MYRTRKLSPDAKGLATTKLQDRTTSKQSVQDAVEERPNIQKRRTNLEVKTATLQPKREKNLRRGFAEDARFIRYSYSNKLNLIEYIQHAALFYEDPFHSRSHKLMQAKKGSSFQVLQSLIWRSSRISIGPFLWITPRTCLRYRNQI